MLIRSLERVTQKGVRSIKEDIESCLLINCIHSHMYIHTETMEMKTRTYKHTQTMEITHQFFTEGLTSWYKIKEMLGNYKDQSIRQRGIKRAPK